MNRIIISDASCLIALSKIGMLNILKDLYQEIIITREVNDEFGGKIPEWIIVIEVKNKQKQFEIEKRLDKGEASSIALALEIEGPTLIMDEIKGRKIAQSLDIDIIGTIGVIILANKRGLIKDIISVILKLVNSGFRLSDKLLEKLIDKYGRK
jgi:predicted nucleic acid-binding protein